MIDISAKIRYDEKKKNPNQKKYEGGKRMKGLLKFFTSILALFGALIGALAIFDRISNKNRMKGDYLECGNTEEPE